MAWCFFAPSGRIAGAAGPIACLVKGMLGTIVAVTGFMDIELTVELANGLESPVAADEGNIGRGAWFCGNARSAPKDVASGLGTLLRGGIASGGF